MSLERKGHCDPINFHFFNAKLIILCTIHYEIPSKQQVKYTSVKKWGQSFLYQGSGKFPSHTEVELFGGGRVFLYLGSGKFPSHTVQVQVFVIMKKHQRRMSIILDKYLFKHNKAL